MYTKFIPVSAIAVMMGVLAACNQQWVYGSGASATETRIVQNFTQVDLRGQGQVIITQGTEEALTIEADDNVLPYLETTVENGTLILDTMPGVSVRPMQPIIFRLTVKDVNSLTLSGSGRINAAKLTVNKLALRVSGSGDIVLAELTTQDLTTAIGGSGNITIDALLADTVNSSISGSGECSLSGTGVTQTITISGSGTHQAQALQSNDAAVLITGSGNISLQAQATLDVIITGSGQVTYSGSARLTQHISGSGKVVHAETTLK